MLVACGHRSSRPRGLGRAARSALPQGHGVKASRRRKTRTCGGEILISRATSRRRRLRSTKAPLQAAGATPPAPSSLDLKPHLFVTVLVRPMPRLSANGSIHALEASEFPEIPARRPDAIKAQVRTREDQILTGERRSPWVFLTGPCHPPSRPPVATGRGERRPRAP